MEAVMISGQHDIVLCDFQDVQVGEPQLIVTLMSLQDDHPVARDTSGVSFQKEICEVNYKLRVNSHRMSTEKVHHTCLTAPVCRFSWSRWFPPAPLKNPVFFSASRDAILPTVFLQNILEEKE